MAEAAFTAAIAAAPPGAAPLRVFGVKVENLDVPAALARLDAALASPGAETLYFVNAHTLNLAAADAGYREVLNGADHVFGDGTGVRWAARTRGHRLLANLNGTDLVPALLRARPGTKVFLLGNTAERIGLAAAGFERLFPQTRLVGFHHGYIHDGSGAAVIEAINRSGAELLLVGMGNPLQERWIDAHKSRLEPRLAVAIGGLMEYWAGGLDRAPAWMRRAGIEWVHILRRHPHKAGRYLLGNPLFLLRLLAWLPKDRGRG